MASDPGPSGQGGSSTDPRRHIRVMAPRTPSPPPRRPSSTPGSSRAALATGEEPMEIGDDGYHQGPWERRGLSLATCNGIEEVSIP